MKKLLMVFAVAAMLAGTARAVTIEHTHSQGIGYESVSFDGGGSYESAYVGRFILQSTTLPAGYPTYTVGTVDGLEANSFYSYCLEPTQSIDYGHGISYSFAIGALAGTDGISAPEAGLINELFGLYSPLLSGDPTGPYTGGTFRTAAAALQLAIWKINLDQATTTLGSWNFGTGNMRVGTVSLESGASATADVVALNMLNSLTGSGPMALGLQGLRSDTTQDLLIQIPEPATMALLGLGALVLRRKKA